MKGIQHLLLLAAFVLLARCQPKVSMSPTLNKIFSGDLFFLNCDNIPSGSGVKWYFNNEELRVTNKTWRIDIAASSHSGSYLCESNGQKSSSLPINVLDYDPSASLTIKTGQPVMRTGSSVILELENEDGLKGWNCWVYRGEPAKKIVLKSTNVNKIVFQPKSLNVLETIFWCSDTQQRRSNQIVVRTSDKAISLEMDPMPAVVGESMTLMCLVWGTDQIKEAVFYKDDQKIQSGSPTYTISTVKDSAMGSYKCTAIFTYKGRTYGHPYTETSDNQKLLVRGPPVKAVLSADVVMRCSCKECPSNSTYNWYHKVDGQSWLPKRSRQGSMMPSQSGTYACRAVWDTGRSSLSTGYVYKPPIKNILIGVITVLVIIALTTVVLYMCYAKRRTTGPIYEDMPMRSRNKGEDHYESVQMGAQRAGEYDTLHPEAPARQRKDGEYEGLKKEEMKEGVYHTLGMEGAVGGEGGYEGLKKEGMKGGEYHTLGEEGYEALKKEGMKGGEYHTLGEEGYEALKKEGMKGGEYHTLGMEGAGGVSEDTKQ